MNVFRESVERALWNEYQNTNKYSLALNLFMFSIRGVDENVSNEMENDFSFRSISFAAVDNLIFQLFALKKHFFLFGCY